ncbi:hypothetical protein ASZ90_018113 [hydrocarbon metagenome]|uniref:DUF4013 domain-containing protein n=1 Tax=hydrocarbon metagenome TaxID=938273 RepID=A0A0W8E7L6_9ZZZZ
MMDHMEYLKFPFRDREWLKKMLLGCIFLIIPIVNILVLGYFVECIRLGIRGKTILPDWSDWEFYLRQGFMALLIFIVYLGIPLLFTFILHIVPILGVMVSSIVTLLAGAIVPMALANSALNNNVMDAFRIGEILDNIKQVIDYYAPAYLIMAIITAIAPAVAVGIPIISFAGVFLMFYSGIVYSNYIGQLYHQSSSC